MFNMNKYISTEISKDEKIYTTYHGIKISFNPRLKKYKELVQFIEKYGILDIEDKHPEEIVHGYKWQDVFGNNFAPFNPGKELNHDENELYIVPLLNNSKDDKGNECKEHFSIGNLKEFSKLDYIFKTYNNRCSN